MKRENIVRFFRFLSENKECQSKAKSFGNDIDALAAYARELGYDLSAEELREHQNKALQLLKTNVQKFSQQPDVPLGPGALELYKFMKLADTDESVAKRLTELSAAAPEELIAYGKEQGFIFNVQDMQAVSKDILKPSDELSDEELQLVAGGDPTLTAFAVVSFGVVASGVAALLVIAAAVLADSQRAGQAAFLPRI